MASKGGHRPASKLTKSREQRRARLITRRNQSRHVRNRRARKA